MTFSAPPPLILDKATHTYRRGSVVLPSVTQVLEDVGIIDYSFLPGETRDAALERGRKVHTLTQYDDEGDLDESTVRPELMPYLDGWRKFRGESGIGQRQIILIEHAMMYEFSYAGTVDRVFDGAFIVDIKTNAIPWWVKIQLAAYAHLLQAERAGQMPRRVAVGLHRDGSYTMKEFPASGYRYDLETFQAALRVHREKRDGK